MFADESAGPEDVDAVGGAGEGLDGFFEGGDGAAGLAEDPEEVVPEGVGLGVFFLRVGPFAGEGDGALADFVPREGHGRPRKGLETWLSLAGGGLGVLGLSCGTRGAEKGLRLKCGRVAMGLWGKGSVVVSLRLCARGCVRGLKERVVLANTDTRRRYALPRVGWPEQVEKMRQKAARRLCALGGSDLSLKGCELHVLRNVAELGVRMG